MIDLENQFNSLNDGSELERFIPDWELKKTITILNEDNSIYAEYDYIDWLQFRILLLQEKRFKEQNFYIRNEHGGSDLIKSGATPYEQPFPIVLHLVMVALKIQLSEPEPEPTQK